MFFLRQPSPDLIAGFLAESAELPLSYRSEGLTQQPPAGFRVDAAAVVIGRGEADFSRAVRALESWAHFDLGWVELFPRQAPIAPGTVVAVRVRHLGFWSLNGCRVLDTLGSKSGPEFGFTYGTLANHAECGEEIFRVSLDPRSEEVCYEIRAVSKPRALLARLGFPVTRHLQARFRRDSGEAMRRVVARARELGTVET